MKDYIIVGGGISGLCFAFQALKQGKSVHLIDAKIHTATITAGGVLNPVVLKRFSAVWKAQEFTEYASGFYDDIENTIKYNCIDRIPVYRAFQSIEEQNDWLVSSDKYDLQCFLDPTIHHFPDTAFQNNLGFGKVKETLLIDTNTLLDQGAKYLDNANSYSCEVFNYQDLQVEDGLIRYKDLQSKYVVFAEGTGVLNNPFIKEPFIKEKKGEYITIKSPGLNLPFILKAGYFVIPLKDDLYKVGATFAHGDYSYNATAAAREAMVAELEEIIHVPFEVVDQEVGMRPTVIDRRPVLGRIHPTAPMFTLNGMGTRGLLMAPKLSEILLNHIENGVSIDRDIDVNRFIS